MTDIDWSERIDQAIREYPEVGEYLEAIRGNIEALASRLAAVEKLHSPVEAKAANGDTIMVCDHCVGDLAYVFDEQLNWPCDTIKAARGD